MMIVDEDTTLQLLDTNNDACIIQFQEEDEDLLTNPDGDSVINFEPT